MKRSLLILAALVAAFMVSACSTTPRQAAADGPLILVSIDGFRWDYLDLYQAPVLQQLAADGVHARRLTPCFPSKTFPNHYTLVTGLRPENHGIIANWFYDPGFGEMFNSRKPESNTDSRWWGGEPVWITAERQGVRSASFFWPGSEAENHGRRPSFYKRFDKSLTSLQRVDGLLAWLALPPEQRPRFATLYFDIVDSAGHTFGPNTPETAAAIRNVDAALQHLLAGLDRLGIRQDTNLVILSDHGMSECGPDRVIFLEDLMDVSKVQVESTGPNGGVRPLSGTPAELVASIRAKNVPHLQVYLREEVPERLHYRNSLRIPPVVLMADDHWNIESKAGWPLLSARYSRGSHGWDPATENMGALFIANGPAFRQRTKIGEVENIHVYNLLCAVLGIRPAPNEGDDRLARLAIAPSRVQP